MAETVRPTSDDAVVGARPGPVVLVVVALLLGLGAATLTRSMGLQLLRVTSNSMQPTAPHDAWLIVGRSDVGADDVERGDIVVFEYPPGSSHLAIKRVVGLPGDDVSVLRDAVIVGRERIPTRSPLGPGQVPPTIPRATVPEGQVFLLGDNSANSIDSRSFGPVDEAQLAGRVFAVVPSTWMLIAPPVGLVAVVALVARRRRTRRTRASRVTPAPRITQAA